MSMYFPRIMDCQEDVPAAAGNLDTDSPQFVNNINELDLTTITMKACMQSHAIH